MTDHDIANTKRYLVVSNASGETVPAFAAMLIIGRTSEGLYQVDQPTTDGATDLIIFNGPNEIPSEDGSGNAGIGVGFDESPTTAALDTADASPVYGDSWGVAAGNWRLRKNVAGWKVIVLTSAASDSYYAKVVRELSASVVEVGEPHTSGTTPPTGFLDWRILILDVGAGTFSVGDAVWVKDANA